MARDTLEIKSNVKGNIIFRNCTLDTWEQKADGTVTEKHQRLNPKTMKWEDRKPKRKRAK